MNLHAHYDTSGTGQLYQGALSRFRQAASQIREGFGLCDDRFTVAVQFGFELGAIE